MTWGGATDEQQQTEQLAIEAALRKLGSELLAIRQQLGISQEQMAARLELGGYNRGRSVSTPRSTISLYENGRRLPSDEVLAIYAKLDPPRAETLTALAMQAKAKAPADTDQTTEAETRPPSRRRFWLLVAIGVVIVGALAGGGITYMVRHDATHPDTKTWTETTGTPAHTWSDYRLASGTAGTPLGPRESVQVSCRIRGYVVQDGDPWWYRLASAPWNNNFYATSDAFYNEGSVSGPVDTGVVVDEQIPIC